MSDYTQVSFATMEQGEQDFQRAYTSLESAIEQLESELNTNLGEWIGSAQEAYKQAQATWHAAMQNMQETIQQISSVIGQANENYQRAESQNSSRWQG